MNAADVARFDELHTKRQLSGLHPDSEVEYQALLERVILGKDGKSEFDTAADSTGIFAQQARELACKEAVEFAQQFALKFGRAVAEVALNTALGAITKR